VLCGFVCTVVLSAFARLRRVFGVSSYSCKGQFVVIAERRGIYLQNHKSSSLSLSSITNPHS